MWEFNVKSSTCFLFFFFFFFFFCVCVFFSLLSSDHFHLVFLFFRWGSFCQTRERKCLHVPDHRSGTLSGCAAWPQGQTGCASASSRYLACWHPRRILHGLTRPRSAAGRERGERREERGGGGGRERSDFDQYQSRLLCPNTD